MAAENERYCFSLGIAVTRWRPPVNILSVSVHKAHPIWTMLANHRKWKQFNIFSWWPQWGSLCGGQWWLVTPISVDFASLGIFIGFNYWLLSSHTSRKVCPPHCLCVCAEVGEQFCRFCKQWHWGCPGPSLHDGTIIGLLHTLTTACASRSMMSAQRGHWKNHWRRYSPPSTESMARVSVFWINRAGVVSVSNSLQSSKGRE